MVKVGLVILARLGSSRLPGKHLKQIGSDLTVIEWLIARISAWQSDLNHQIILATSIDPINRQFEVLKVRNAIKIFYGDDGNIPLRLQQVAEEYYLDQIIAYGGDNPLSSMEATSLVNTELEQGADYVEVVGLPIGMNVFGFRVDCLNRSLKGYAEQIDLEFGWNQIISSAAKDNRVIDASLEGLEKEVTDLRITLDYPSDLEFFRAVFDQVFGGQVDLRISDRALVKEIIERGLARINGDLSQEYWQRFQRGLDRTFDDQTK